MNPDSDPEQLVVVKISIIIIINPFTAEHAGPSLGKRTIKVPNLKSLTD